MNKTTSAVKAGIRHDSSGKPKVFTLSLGTETVTLDPGKSWIKLDEFKWVTRGLVEAPQSFHVLATGAVDINGERIALDEAEAISKLEHEINKSHLEIAVPRSSATSPAAKTSHALAPTGHPDKVSFHVRLDHMGHLVIECIQGEERVGTGLRGLPMLVQNGLMLQPKSVHVDPLQKHIEIDGVKCECTEAGARQLQNILNTQYAPSLKAKGEDVVDIRDNPASPTGFDIHFVTAHSGLRIEVKGHLSQEKLDILQDQMKCDLLKPGILMRLSPPNLLVRRRRPDGGEERIPEFPDIHYRRVNAQQLQLFFNHPLLRRKSGGVAGGIAASVQAQPVEIVALRLTKNPQNKMTLWLESLTSRGGQPEGKAFTHHNVAELQHNQVFLPHLDVALSLDNRTLSILNKETRQEQHVQVDIQCPEEDLNLASQMLTAALKPPTPQAQPQPAPLVAAVEAVPEMAQPPPAQNQAEETPASQMPTPAPAATETKGPEADLSLTSDEFVASAPKAGADPPPDAVLETVANEPALNPVESSRTEIPPEPSLDPKILALFSESDSSMVNAEVFRHLSRRLDAPIQDVLLDMPRIFTGRRFEIISLAHDPINDAFQLRSEGFTGFYLSHVHDQQTLFVYACGGRHVEWGSERCFLRAAVSAEPNEFTGPGLLGMALDKNRQFVFVVSPACKEWIKPRVKLYQEIYAHFIAVKDLAAEPDEYDLVWPVAPEAFP